MSRQSHVDKMQEDRDALRKRLEDYRDEQCPDPLPVDAWKFGTMQLPAVTPSPLGLPPLKFFCAVCGLGIGAGQWAYLNPGATLTDFAVASAAALAANPELWELAF